MVSIVTAFGYGEDRYILPVGGGMPTNKVYNPNTHKRVSWDTYYKNVNEKVKYPKQYLSEFCGCKLCKWLYMSQPNYKDFREPLFVFADGKSYKRGGRKYMRATNKAQDSSTKHFVWNKIKEIEAFNKDIKLTDDTNLWNTSSQNKK